MDGLYNLAVTGEGGDGCSVSPGGVGNLRDGVRLSTNDAMDTAEGFWVLGIAIWVVDDSLAPMDSGKFACTDRYLAHPTQPAHMNVETYASPTGPGVRGAPVDNVHVYLPEEP